MSKLVEGIRDEIRRQARKEIRDAVEPLNKKLAVLRHALTQANKKIETLEKQLKRPGAGAPVKLAADAAETEAPGRSGPRLSGGLIKKLRTRFGISQGELAQLLGVSHSAVASWEQSRVNPRKEARAQIIALRSLTPAQLRAKLAGTPAGEDGTEPAEPKNAGGKESAVTAETIKKMRKKLGISQNELAVLIGVSSPAVSTWEQGRAKPRRGTLARIMTLRNLSPAQIRKQLEGETVAETSAETAPKSATE